MILIIRSLMELCINTTVQDVALDTRSERERICWTQIVGVDRDNAPATLEVGLKRGRQFVPCNADTPAAAARCIRMQGTVRGSGDWVPCARFYGATAADDLELYAAGYVLES